MTGPQPVATGRGVAVSLTPVSLDADARAFRIARALSEAGFASVVVEGRASTRRFWDGAIQVRTVRKRPTESRPGSIFRPGRLHKAIQSLRDGHMGAPGEALLYAGFRVHDWWRYCWQPLPFVPPAALYVLHSYEFYRAVEHRARRSGARILYDAHDFYREIDPPERQASFDRNRLRPFLCRLEDRLVGAADAFTTVGNGVAGLMAHAFGRAPEVIRNCHDERCDRPDARPLRQVLGLGETDRLGVMVGNCKRGIAIQMAAAALKYLPENVHLAFLGRGYETAAATLPRELLGRRLHLGHAVAPDEIVPAIRSADVGLVLYEPCSENYRYALPNGFFQVIAAGLPIVRGELPEIEAVIRGAAVGYSLPRLEPEAIAQAISRAVAEGDMLRANVGVLARKLRWENEARRFHQLIDSILARQAAPRAASLDAAS